MAFVRHANLTFGGGSATIAVLHQQIVARRSWITELQFNLAYALSRLTPGTNLLAFCTAAGWIARRWAGALIALLAASLPCSVMVVLVTHFYAVWRRNPAVLAGLRGATAAAVAIMFYTAWHLASPLIKTATAKALVIIPLTIVLTFGVSLSPVRVLLLAAIVGGLWPAPEPTA